MYKQKKKSIAMKDYEEYEQLLEEKCSWKNAKATRILPRLKQCELCIIMKLEDLREVVRIKNSNEE